MDLIESSADSPLAGATGLRRGLRAVRAGLLEPAGPLRRAGPRLRTGAVLLAAAALLALRAGLAGGPPGWAAVSAPPYDQLPGRTPIPAPALLADDPRVVQGEIPASTPAGSERDRTAAARRAAALVLGRYCRHPEALTIKVDPAGTGAVALVSDRRTGRFLATIVLYSDGSGAGPDQWRGWLAQLDRCR